MTIPQILAMDRIAELESNLVRFENVTRQEREPDGRIFPKPGSCRGGIMPQDQTEKQLVILIHGTFATSHETEGNRWWQRGSPFWNKLSESLGDSAGMDDSGELFKWSGENSERARHIAAIDLLKDWLIPLEQKGRDYHLVAHSHGGNVLREALVRSRRKNIALKHLRSWTTVGTPFLLYLPSRSFLSSSLRLAFAITAFLSALAGTGVTSYALAQSLNPFDTMRFTAWAKESGTELHGYFDPFDEPVSNTEHPSYRNNKEAIDSYYRYRDTMMLKTFVVKAVSGLMLWSICAGLGVIVFVWYTIPIAEGYAVLRDLTHQRKAYSAHSSGWLGIWSEKDEAINGLRHGLSISGTLVPRIKRTSKRVFDTDGRGSILRPISLIYAGAFNRIFAPIADKLVRSQLRASLVGNNRPGCEIISVTTMPVLRPNSTFSNVSLVKAVLLSPIRFVRRPIKEITALAWDNMSSYKGLPESVDQCIISGSDTSARSVVAHFRQAMSSQILTDAANWFSAQLTYEELVHNSYFANEDVIRLIAFHINSHSQNSAAGQDQQSSHCMMDKEIMDWYFGRIS